MTRSKQVEGVRVQDSARESLLRAETRNLKPGTRHPILVSLELISRKEVKEK